MNRPRNYTIAAILFFIYSVIGIAFEIPNLIQGTAASTQYDGGGPPFFLVLINFATSVMGLVSSYGVWKMQKWGVMLSIVLTAISMLASVPAVLFAPTPYKIAGVIAIIWCAVVIVLLLRPHSQPIQKVAELH